MSRLARLLEALAGKPVRTVIGLISGTSADAVDAAGVDIEGAGEQARVRVRVTLAHPYPAGLGQRLRALTEGGSVREVCELNVTVGECFAQAALAVLDRLGGADLIGSHGQTIYYLPPDGRRMGSTLQIGEPAVIAERTGLLTVGHFREGDLAAGGTGAPLVPYADYVLFRDPVRTRIVQNIGGIANATVLPAGGGIDAVYAFDTGPGNMVIDTLTQLLTGEPFDRDGALAARGTVDEVLLAELLEGDDYLAAPPPKATGRERYGRPYAERVLDRGRARGLLPEDLVATATALTAESIVQQYRRFVFPRQVPDEVVVSGGGVHNATLMGRLARALAPLPLRTASELGVDSDAKEAIAFAILAHDAVMGLATNVPGATGARHRVVLGAIYPGPLLP